MRRSVQLSIIAAEQVQSNSSNLTRPGHYKQWTRGPGTWDPGTQGSSAVTGDRNATTSQKSWLYHCLEYASQLGTNRKTLLQHYPLACLHHFSTSEYYQIAIHVPCSPAPPAKSDSRTPHKATKKHLTFVMYL